MNYKIAVIPGDGIGPEVTASAIDVLNAVGKKYGHTFNYESLLMGGCAIDDCGDPLPEITAKTALASDSVLLGAVGGYKWDTLPGNKRPEHALLAIRKILGLYANIRPAKLFAPLKDASPLKPEITEKGIDLVVVRELTGGIYFGERGTRTGKDGIESFDTECYSEMEVARIARIAFEYAMLRKKHVTSIDKANVLESSRLWRRVVHEVAKEYPAVTVIDMLVDNAAMQLIQNPSQFDVIVTSNLFGDILSDEASQLTGSIGLLASASLGEGTRGMYEPIHGSAPDIAGQGIANPIATILSAAMMLSLSFGLAAEAKAVEDAVAKVLASGARTKDIAAGGAFIPGAEMTDRIIAAL